MHDVKCYSVLCNSIQHKIIDRCQSATGQKIEHYNTLPHFLKVRSYSRHSIIFVNWCPRNVSASKNMLTRLRQQVSQCNYLIALSPTDAELESKDALEAGADRFFRNDIPGTVLVEVTNAIARRLCPFNEVTYFPPYRMIQKTREVYVGDEKIQLSSLEFRTIQYLFENSGHVLSRSALLKDVWDLPELVHSRRVDTRMSLIRNKIRLDGTFGWSLVHRRGQGYQLQSVNDLRPPLTAARKTVRSCRRHQASCGAAQFTDFRASTIRG